MPEDRTHDSAADRTDMHRADDMGGGVVGTDATEEVTRPVTKGGGNTGPQDGNHSWDSIGDEVDLPPEQVGTVAGNTTAAGATMSRPDDKRHNG